MCGICGVVQVTGTPRPVVHPGVLEAMMDIMVHRGPDDQGAFVADGIALGARRLSIVDVAGGHQPFGNEAGDVQAVQNGELYNHEELRAGLVRDGHSMRSRCDTEILPHLYERDGVRFAERLRGDYGIAVWDDRRRRLVLARDRAGVKPLYYARSGDLLVFASELKSLLASGLVDVELDVEAIEVFLNFGYVPGPNTVLKGVHKLMPGERMVVEDGEASTERYWEYPEQAPASRLAAGAADEHAKRVLELLEESVRLRLMSDVPLGAMLSGGLDSSLLVALMARNATGPVKTFSIGFAEAGEANELPVARRVAGLFGTEHHEVELSFGDVADLETLVWHLDEPTADLSALGFLALSQLAAETVTVALSGQGADELLGGYRKHRASVLADAYGRVPGARALAGHAASHVPDRVSRMVRTLAAGNAADRHIAMSGQLDSKLRERLFDGPPASGSSVSYRAVEPFAGAGEGFSGTLHLDGQLGLVDGLLHYFDRASMAHSLEVRVPFLDHVLIELCAGVPSNLKVRRMQTKHLLKHAARGLLPDDIIDRRKIGFFRQSVSSWFQAQTATAIKDYLLSGEPRYAEFLDRRVVEEEVRAFSEGGGPDRSQLLLAILVLEVWLSTFLPRATAAARQPVS